MALILTLKFLAVYCFTFVFHEYLLVMQNVQDPVSHCCECENGSIPINTSAMTTVMNNNKQLLKGIPLRKHCSRTS